MSAASCCRNVLDGDRQSKATARTMEIRPEASCWSGRIFPPALQTPANARDEVIEPTRAALTAQLLAATPPDCSPTAGPLRPLRKANKTTPKRPGKPSERQTTVCRFEESERP